MNKRIAEVIPLINTIPPKKYGGIEVIAQELSLGFAKKGYKIGVFCAKGSQLKEPNIDLVESSPYPSIEDLSQNRKFEINEFLKVLSNQSNFDLFHFHYEPIVLNCTIDSIEFNFLKFIPNSTIIYNGIDIKKLPFKNEPGDYLLFLGRITDFKGILEAIQIANLVNIKLVIAAKVDPTDEDFYNQKVKPLIDGVKIVYVGEVEIGRAHV